MSSHVSYRRNLTNAVINSGVLGTAQMSEVCWDWVEDGMGACSKAAAHALCHQLNRSFDVSQKKQEIQNFVQNCPSSKILFNSLILTWGWGCGPSLHIPELTFFFETHKHYMLCWILGLEGQWNRGAVRAWGATLLGRDSCPLEKGQNTTSFFFF